MRLLKYEVQPGDEGRQIKRIIRGKMGVSHRVFSDLKQRHGFILDGEAVFANHVVHAGQIIELTLMDEEGGKAAWDEHPVNAWAPENVVTPGMVAVLRAVQPLKALAPIDVIRAGRTSISMALLFWKHWFPILENGTTWGVSSAARSS